MIWQHACVKFCSTQKKQLCYSPHGDVVLWILVSIGQVHVYIYVNISWCSNYTIKYSSCTADVEILCVQCRPHYLPREISCAALIAVYIPPNGDRSKAVETIASVTSEVQRAHPDAVVLIVGDFNGAALAAPLTSYSQYVDFNSCASSCLDVFYSNIKRTYRAINLPAIGQSVQYIL